MLIEVPAVLTPSEAAGLRDRLERAAWHDGSASAGHVAARAKSNLQLADDDPLVQELGTAIAARLSSNPAFVAAALPHRILPPRFNCYTNGGAYGRHIDSAVLSAAHGRERIRSDLSATLFISEPDSYEGGELTAEFGLARQAIKLAAGHLLLYPANTLHQVSPVRSGKRYAAFFWIQSLVRSATQRAMLLDLDTSIQAIAANDPGDPEIVRLTGLYHNLLREWAET